MGNAFRSRARVFATAESKRETVVEEVERQVVINKSSGSAQSSKQNIMEAKISGSSSALAQQSSAVQSSSAAAAQSSSSHALRAGSTYSRAGSMARSSVLR